MVDYNIFFRFYNKFKAQNFQDIDSKDSLLLEIEDKLQASGQFFHIADFIQLKIIYLCSKCHTFFGVQCEHMDPSVYFENTHPEDIQRHAVSRSKVVKTASEMFQDKSDNLIISSHFKTKTASGEYKELLYQLCLIYSETPIKTVHAIQVNTDVTGLLEGHHGYHFYIGNDLSFFRYPDKELLMTGNVFSKREFDIIKGIAQGLESQEIADQLFISVHTVNTHRRNILSKTGKRSTHELVHELKESGMI